MIQWGVIVIFSIKMSKLIPIPLLLLPIITIIMIISHLQVGSLEIKIVLSHIIIARTPTHTLDFETSV